MRVAAGAGRARLAEVNAAYEILGKPDRRADYDRQRARSTTISRPPTRRPIPTLDRTWCRHGSGSAGDAAAGAPSAASGNFRPRAPRGLLEAIAIVGVVVIAITPATPWSATGRTSPGRLQDAGARRPAGPPARHGGPTDRSRPRHARAAPGVVPPVTVPATPTARAGCHARAAEAEASRPAQGSARMSNQSPPRRSDGRHSPSDPRWPAACRTYRSTSSPTTRPSRSASRPARARCRRTKRRGEHRASTLATRRPASWSPSTLSPRSTTSRSAQTSFVPR